jgi:hypothetical protein
MFWFAAAVDPASLPAGMRPGPSLRLVLPSEPGAVENLRVPVLSAE